MGTIQQTKKEYSGKTASYSMRVEDVTPADWPTTVRAQFIAVTDAVDAITYGTNSDTLYAPDRTYTPNVAPPTTGNAQLGVRWDIFGVDDVNGRRYLVASIPTANAEPGGTNLLLPGSDQADSSETLVSNLFDALNDANLVTPEGNEFTDDSWTMFLNQRRDYTTR